jgi:hypothetical protein
MNDSWYLGRIDEVTGHVTDDCFVSNGLDPLELDLVLVGTHDGPASKLWSLLTNEDAVSQSALQTCAELLPNADAIPVVSPKQLASDCAHSVGAEYEQRFHDQVVERAREFRDFVLRATRQGWKVAFWCDEK